MKSPLLRLYAVLYLLFLFAPIVLLPLFAFNDGKIIAFPLSGFSTRWFEALWERPALHGAVQSSLVIAVVTAIVATIFGIFAARGGALADYPFKGSMIGFIMLPLVLPEIILAVALLVVVTKVLGLAPNLFTIVLAHVLICTPYATSILNGAFANLDRSFEEAAMDLGESRWGAFRLVTLPLVMPGIISAMLISFIISLDEFIIAFFLSGNVTTLPVYIYGLRRQSDELPIIMALGTILVTLSIILLVVAEIFRRRGMRRAGLKDTGGFL
ncbi:MAG: ABC transporter permease [Rubellimicrobium sp.]|nr:ABC transporter permease [Rubellimicrobium sp.]